MAQLLLERGADPLLKDLGGGTPLDSNTAAFTADVQSMVDFEASMRQVRQVAIGRERESAASEQSKRNQPASMLLQRAIAARKSQHEARRLVAKHALLRRDLSLRRLSSHARRRLTVRLYK